MSTIRRDGVHVTIGTPRPLADNFAPSGRALTVKLNKEVLKPKPGFLQELFSLFVYCLVTVSIAGGIVLGIFRLTTVLFPTPFEAPAISLAPSEDRTPSCGSPDYYEHWDGFDWYCFPTWWSDGYRSSGANSMTNTAIYLSATGAQTYYALLVGSGVSEFNDTVEIKGRLIVNGVDITPKKEDKK